MLNIDIFVTANENSKRMPFKLYFLKKFHITVFQYFTQIN